MIRSVFQAPLKGIGLEISLIANTNTNSVVIYLSLTVLLNYYPWIVIYRCKLEIDFYQALLANIIQCTSRLFLPFQDQSLQVGSIL